MICPHCAVGVKLDFDIAIAEAEYIGSENRILVQNGHCPECNNLIVMLQRKSIFVNEDRRREVIDIDTIVWPFGSRRVVDLAVPEPYKVDFLEACDVLPTSPKASAALSRRLLQKILRDVVGVKHTDLSKELDEFIGRGKAPTYLTDAIDSVRNFGNFAAHPLKDMATGEIIEVEPGEAEWLLEILDTLFDFVFVQPQRLEERRRSLNSKLTAAGKPPMKGTPKSIP